MVLSVRDRVAVSDNHFLETLPRVLNGSSPALVDVELPPSFCHRQGDVDVTVETTTIFCHGENHNMETNLTKVKST